MELTTKGRNFNTYRRTCILKDDTRESSSHLSSICQLYSSILTSNLWLPEIFVATLSVKGFIEKFVNHNLSEALLLQCLLHQS